MARIKFQKIKLDRGLHDSVVYAGCSTSVGMLSSACYYIIIKITCHIELGKGIPL